MMGTYPIVVLCLVVVVVNVNVNVPNSMNKPLHSKCVGRTSSSVSSARVIILEAQEGGGNKGGMKMRGALFDSSISKRARLKLPPH